MSGTNIRPSSGDRDEFAAAKTPSELLDELSLDELKEMRNEILRRLEAARRDLIRVEDVLESKRGQQ